MEQMTRIETLRALQARIRESKGADRELDVAIWDEIDPSETIGPSGKSTLAPYYTTDPDGLGACVALLTAALPGWKREVRQMSDGFWVRLIGETWITKQSGFHALEAHAHLLSIVAAVLAEEESKTPEKIT